MCMNLPACHFSDRHYELDKRVEVKLTEIKGQRLLKYSRVVQEFIY